MVNQSLFWLCLAPVLRQLSFLQFDLLQLWRIMTFMLPSKSPFNILLDIGICWVAESFFFWVAKFSILFHFFHYFFCTLHSSSVLNIEYCNSKCMVTFYVLFNGIIFLHLPRRWINSFSYRRATGTLLAHRDFQS